MTIIIILLYIKDIFRVENNLYSPCPNLEGIETRIVVKQVRRWVPLAYR